MSTDLRQKLEIIRNSHFWRERVFAFADLDIDMQWAVLNGRTIAEGAAAILKGMDGMFNHAQETADERTEA